MKAFLRRNRWRTLCWTAEGCGFVLTFFLVNAFLHDVTDGWWLPGVFAALRSIPSVVGWGVAILWWAGFGTSLMLEENPQWEHDTNVKEDSDAGT